MSDLLAERYRLHRRLAKGAMGTVWLATDTRLDAPVAVKLLDPKLTGNRAARRFLNEARAMARLRHPHVVTVHDHGEADGQVYLVMEWLEGGSTMGWIKRHGPAPVDQAARWLRQVLDALGAVHGAGLVHRDLKPQNVLLTGDGDAKLGDFGIVHLGGDETRLTTSGSPLGTAAYAAPEQFVDAAEVDGRADLYGAGATFFRWVTDRSPLMLYQPEQHRELLAGLDPEVAAFVVRATRFEPGQRYADAQAMAAGLERMLRRMGGVHTPAPARRAATPASSPWLPVAAAAGIAVPGVALVAALGIAAAAWTRSPAPPEEVAQVAPAPPPDPAPAPPPATPAPQPPPEAPPPAPVVLGRVFVNALPPAEVVIDGTARGSTPWSGTLPTGSHSLELRGPTSWRTPITVTRDAEVRLCWDFRAEGPCPRF